MNILKLTLASAVAISINFNAFSDDWPAWRGKNADGTTTETIQASDKIVWSKDLGPGYSAVSVKDNMLISAANINDVDYIYCFNATTGEDIWKFSVSSSKGRRYPGTLGTPIIANDKVFFLTRTGNVIALDFKTGKLLWNTQILNNGTSSPRWQLSSSVVVYKNLAIVDVGNAGTALDIDSGKIVWQSKGTGTHSTPTIFTLNNVAYAVMRGAKNFSVVQVEDGKVIAQYPWENEYDICGASAIVLDGGKRIFITSGYKTGRATMFSFDGKALKDLWTIKHLNSQFSTPVYYDGVIYGSHGDTNSRNALTAIDAKTGELLWIGSIRFGSPIIAGDKIVYLDESGVLHYVKTDQFEEDIIGSFKVFNGGKCWQMPVVANGYIYCRNSLGKLICINAK